ncbi:MAG: DUF1800 domain-containing protein [Steroidobacteraceae bacterium]
MHETDAAVAANRFGLGARPGEIRAMGSGAREALLAQLAGAAPLITEQLPHSAEIINAAAARRAASNAARLDGQPPALKAAPALREVYQPAYVAEALARFRQAVAAERSFVERLVQFWGNHFAVSIDKLAVLGIAGALEREAIRPHVLGNFADMLRAVEQHPAMLLYLDNQRSAGPNSVTARSAARRGREVGLNENLGREILELHTLGVGGAYGQQDVRALAMIVSGWSVGSAGGREAGGEPGRFQFRAALHEPDAQVLLGKRYAAAGLAQGEAALRDLALHPATARHLAAKLARHFVADEPPPALVDRLATTFLHTQGDLPAVYRALVGAPEGWRQPLAKFKTPADYIHSAWRALQLPVGATARDLRIFEELGQRTFQPRSPAGWPDRSADWDGSAALMKRLEWAQSAAQRLGSQRNALQLADECLGAVCSQGSRQAVARAQDGAQALTLFLGMPEFMRR